MKAGILGGGQLGLMLAQALQALGHQPQVLEPNADSPCHQRLPGVVTAAFDDEEALTSLFAECDAVTFDSENVPAAPLATFAQKLKPALHVLSSCQDRIAEKTLLKEGGVATASFVAVPRGDDVRAAARAFGLPCVAKTARGGYDGKGQYLLRTEADVEALPPDAPFGWVLEELLALKAEVSCIVARSGPGEAVAFPLFENLHEAHVLDFTVVPARLDEALQSQAKAAALALADGLDVVGLLTVEFFLAAGRDGQTKLLVNELAPRAHNSGHVTRKACTVSQFDLLARVLCGAPLAMPELLPGVFVMGQLLGDVWEAQGLAGGPLRLDALDDFPDVLELFSYGKLARQKRKMGHFIVHGATAEGALSRARAFREALKAQPLRGA